MRDWEMGMSVVTAQLVAIIGALGVSVLLAVGRVDGEPSTRPVMRKLGTIDCDMVETTPVVFRDRLYRVEYVREHYPQKAAGESGSYFRLIDVATRAPTAPFARGFHLCSAIVDGDSVWVFGVEKWGGQKIQLFHSQDLKQWDSALALE